MVIKVVIKVVIINEQKGRIVKFRREERKSGIVVRIINEKKIAFVFRRSPFSEANENEFAESNVVVAS